MVYVYPNISDKNKIGKLKTKILQNLVHMKVELTKKVNIKTTFQKNKLLSCFENKAQQKVK